MSVRQLLYAWLLVFLGLAAGCNKHKEAANPADEPLAVYDNVLVVDSTRHRLDTTPGALAAGIYRFSTTGSEPLGARVGTVIVGDQGEGFLRKVTAVQATGNQSVLQTRPARMNELFSTGMLHLNFTSDSLAAGRTTKNPGFHYETNNRILVTYGPAKLTLREALIDFNPGWHWDMNFGADSAFALEAGVKNGQLKYALTLNATAGAAATIPTGTYKLLPKPYHRKFRFYARVPGLPIPVPVVIHLYLDADVEYTAFFNSGFNRNFNIDAGADYTLYMRYADKSWSCIRDVVPTFTGKLEPGNSLTANGDVKVTPKMKARFYVYNMAGPYLAVGTPVEPKMTVNLATYDTDWEVKAWAEPEVGISGKLFGFKIPDYYASAVIGETSLYRAADKLTVVAGDNQTGTAGRALTTPVKVRVVDTEGIILSQFPVYFVPVNAGSGSVATAKVLTDASGYAQTTWTLGTATTTPQYLNALVKKADGTTIPNAPVRFTATATTTTTTPTGPCANTPMQLYSTATPYSFRAAVAIFATGTGVGPLSLSVATSRPVSFALPSPATSTGCSISLGFDAKADAPTSPCTFTYTITDAQGRTQTSSVTANVSN